MRFRCGHFRAPWACYNSLITEARLAIIKVNEGAKILTDLFYQLSQSRRAQITPALNIIAKNTAEIILTDELLSGSFFGEQMKKASMEKSSREIVKTPLTMSSRVQQTVKQPSQVIPARSKNARTPVKHWRSATRRTGATNNNRRSYHRSQTRRR